MEDDNQSSILTVLEPKHLAFLTSPMETASTPPKGGSLSVPRLTINVNAILDERETEVNMYEEPYNATARSSPPPGDQEVLDERQVAARLGEELEDIAKRGFMPTEVITYQEEFANSTFETYFTKSANGKYNTIGYIDNLKAKYMRLHQA